MSRSKAGLKNGVSIRGLELIEEADDELICVPTPKIGQRACALTLWTRQGVTACAKLLNTPAAWRFIEKLADNVNDADFFKFMSSVEREEAPVIKRVYVFEFADKVKIGVSGDVESRRRTLENGSGSDIVRSWQSAPLEKEDAFNVERKAHEYFSEHRLKGEYFTVPFSSACKVVGKFLDLLGDHCQGKTLG